MCGIARFHCHNIQSQTLCPPMIPTSLRCSRDLRGVLLQTQAETTLADNSRALPADVLLLCGIPRQFHLIDLTHAAATLAQLVRRDGDTQSVHE